MSAHWSSFTYGTQARAERVSHSRLHHNIHTHNDTFRSTFVVHDDGYSHAKHNHRMRIHVGRRNLIVPCSILVGIWVVGIEVHPVGRVVRGITPVTLHFHCE